MAGRLSFQELLAQVKKMPSKELRFDEPESVEIVFGSAQYEDLESVLEPYFGPAAKPRGVNPAREITDLTEAFGGVRDDQTLYYLENDGACYFGMIWPWGDRASMTLRLFKTSQ